MHEIDTELGIDYADCGPWRSYHLYAIGDTEREMREDASITEIDQDGGELNCYGLEDARLEVENAVTILIKEKLGLPTEFEEGIKELCAV